MGDPFLPEVFEAVRPYCREELGHPSSAHKFGSKLKGVIETARAVARMVGRGSKPLAEVLVSADPFSEEHGAAEFANGAVAVADAR